MWVQCILEGQINGPTQDDTHSTESGQTETLNLFKELLHHAEENIWVRVVMILIVRGEHMKIKGPLKEEDTKSEWEATR